jgi:cyclopropane fatty-acyl-phospholipid synthase-like methyltransferase
MSKNIVKTGYNKIAKKYSSNRDQFKNNKYLDKLVNLLKPGSKILDIGCGSGVPIDKYLFDQGFEIKGIDISEEQIKLAQKNLPKCNLEVKDIAKLKKDEYSVDAVVSFYTIFHIPRENHLDLLKKIKTYLNKNGLLLITMGSSEWEGKENFHGTQMWWSHYGAEKNKRIIKQAGFKIIFDEIDKSGGENHLVVLARKS